MDLMKVSSRHFRGYQPHDFQIRIGSTNHTGGGELIQVKEIHPHPDYKSDDYDYSLLRLNEKITFDNTKRPVPLAKKYEFIKQETNCVSTGWGNTKNSSESEPNDQLRSVSVPIWHQSRCVNTYRGFKTVTSRMICAGGKGG